MLRCLAIDDEELALELLEDNIRKVPYLQLVAACGSPFEALEILQHEKIDLVFLDIQMPGLTGLQFIKSLPQQCMYILVTAYEKYALDGFNLNVVDYLVKPVALERFMMACHKARELYILRNKEAAPKETSTGDYFFISADYSLLKVMYEDVAWIEGLKDYIRIHLKSSDKPIIARMSMKAIEEQLPPAQFLRVHKSYILSKKSITSIRKNSIFLGQLELPVGDSYKEGVDAFVRNRY